MIKPGLHVSIDWWRWDIPKTYEEKYLMMSIRYYWNLLNGVAIYTNSTHQRVIGTVNTEKDAH